MDEKGKLPWPPDVKDAPADAKWAVLDRPTGWWRWSSEEAVPRGARMVLAVEMMRDTPAAEHYISIHCSRDQE